MDSLNGSGTNCKELLTYYNTPNSFAHCWCAVIKYGNIVWHYPTFFRFSREKGIKTVNFCFKSVLSQWQGGGKQMSSVQQELQIWSEGALNNIELIWMNSIFAQILGKLIKIKCLKFEEFWKFEQKKSKFSLVRNPLTSQKLARYSRSLSHRFGW